MMEEKRNGPLPANRMPYRVLSTSLGVALAAHMLLLPGLPGGGAASAEENGPKLVEWSNDDVKQYFNPSLDWSLPITDAGTPAGSPQVSPSPNADAGSGGTSAGGAGAAPIIIRQGGGFGWDDLLLYHLLFNRGGSYSSGGWERSHPVYDPRTQQPYQPRTYSEGAFQNKPVPGSNVKPKTSASSGSFTTKQGASKSSSGSGSSSGGTSSGTSSGTSAGNSSGTSSKSGSSSSSGKSTSSSSGSIGGKSGGFSSGGSSSGS